MFLSSQMNFISTQFQELRKLKTAITDNAAEIAEVTMGWGFGKPITSPAKYEELMHYYQHACSAYDMVRYKLVTGTTLVAAVKEHLSDSHGFVARDDSRREIIVAFRGSVTYKNWVTDLKIQPAPLDSVNLPGVHVHCGFRAAWLDLAIPTLAAVEAQLHAFPEYTLVVAGHSLGGAIAALASITLKQKHPAIPLQLYTYGAPRVGNPMFARYATDLLGFENVHRVVRGCDGIPTSLPVSLGYRHFGTEYWHLNPIGHTRTFICNAAGPYEEDPEGSARVPSCPLSPDHINYFIASKLPPGIPEDLLPTPVKSPTDEKSTGVEITTTTMSALQVSTTVTR